MKVIIHTGVHCTDDDRLLKALLRNVDGLRHSGVAIPGPGRYRQLLSDLVNGLAHGAPAPDAREVVLDSILNEDPDQITRLILCHENLFSVPKLTLGGGRFYRKAETRMASVCKIFEGDEVALFMGLRNPATFLPAVWHATPHDTFDGFMNGVDPTHLRWSDLIRRLRSDVPDVSVTVWCNEDTPLIWGALIRAMAGMAPEAKITGAFDLMAELVSPAAMARFRAFLKENPQINETQKRRVMTAFLEKFALDDAIEEELDVPGWDTPYVERLTQLYDADMAVIEQMPGVRFIAP